VVVEAAPGRPSRIRSPTLPEIKLTSKLPDQLPVPLVCPICRTTLVGSAAGLRCPGCDRHYPVVDGRPWFIEPAGAWSPPTPPTGSRLRRWLSSPPHPARLVGEITAGGVSNDHRALRDFLAQIPESEPVLDLGSGERRLRPKIVNLDIISAPNVDVVADGHRLPFPDGVFRAVICQSVIEHVLEPAVMIAECARVLQPGGELWLEAPFLYPIHDSSDYYRWTLSGLRHLVSTQLTVVRSGALMGPSSALSLSWRAFINWRLGRWHWALRNGVAWMTGWIKVMDPDELMSDPPEIYAHSYILAVKSKPEPEPPSGVVG
jgi:SAM-dependent methyltransferase